MFPLRFHGTEAQVIMAFGGMDKERVLPENVSSPSGQPTYSAARCSDPEQAVRVGTHLLVSFHESMQGGNLNLVWPTSVFHAPSPSNWLRDGLTGYISKFRVNPGMFARISRKGSSISEGLETGRL